MTLAAIQHDFRAWLHTGDASTRIGGSTEPGLAVYQNNYRAQLASCLEGSFVRTRQWIGGEAFHAAIVNHVDRMPPSSWTLDAYPRDFPATLALCYPDDPEVPELATLELALADAFVGADAPALDAGALGAVDWDRAVLRFVPTLDLHPLTSNAAAIWTALTGEQTTPPAALLPRPATLLTWRQDDLSRFRVLDDGEAAAIRRARAGAGFAALCAWAIAEHGEEAGVAMAAGWLGCWLVDGLLNDITQGEE